MISTPRQDRLVRAETVTPGYLTQPHPQALKDSLGPARMSQAFGNHRPSVAPSATKDPDPTGKAPSCQRLSSPESLLSPTQWSPAFLLEACPLCSHLLSSVTAQY